MGKVSKTSNSVPDDPEAGELAAVRQLWDFYPAIIAFVKRRGFGKDAEDIAGDVLVKLLKLAKTHHDSLILRPDAYVWTVVRNMLNDHIRKSKVESRVFGHRVDEMDVASKSLSHEDMAAEKEAESKAFEEWFCYLREVLTVRFSERDRSILDSLVAGKSLKEAAKLQNISEKTAQRIWYRFKDRIAFVGSRQDFVDFSELRATDRSVWLNAFSRALKSI